MTEITESSDFVEMVLSPAGMENLLASDPPLKIIGLGPVDPDAARRAVASMAALPLVVVGVAPAATPGESALADLTLEAGSADLRRVVTNIHANPRASVALALLLRGAERRSLSEGLVAESATYSALQAGPEFSAWLAQRSGSGRAADHHPVVRIDRDRDALHITLHRPEVHNALNTEMRDALYEALLVAASDPSLRVVLDGDGPSFCAGGDLSEFGSLPDPANAHLVRLRRSIGRLLSTMADRVEVVLHGACLGAGIELPAFAGHVVARPGARLGLPEIALGLVPGAGGTVSVTRRIGRHRTALLALSGEAVDAPTALAWGLVDEISDAVVSRPG